MNNNPSSKHKSFESTIISTNTNDLQNNELKSPVSPAASDECLESSSVPDADLTESLATATEALTEILVKTSINENKINNKVIDTNGNTSATTKYPNVSSSSTQTECPPSSSYHTCCCKEWNCWKSAEDQKERCNGNVQCQSSRCCHHRRKKVNSTETVQEKTNCECNVSKYSKNWRELRKTTNKRSTVHCRFQSCNNRNSKPV